MGLSDSRRSHPPVMYSGLVFRAPSGALPRRVSQVPRLICPCALPPLTPEGPATACTHCLIASYRFHPYPAGWPPPSRNEAETGSLYAAARRFAFRGFAKRIAPLHARSATCRMGNLHGEFLSPHKISQAYPGAPDERRWTRI